MGDPSRLPECPCPPMGLIDVVGKKWAICVITLLGANGSLRFGVIQRALPGVSPATLAATLRTLQHESLIVRRPLGRRRFDPSAYSLTAQGSALYRSLQPLASWLRRS